MALSQAYVNEVLNHLKSTIVVDEEVWPGLVKALHFEDRDLTRLVIGQMSLRHTPGGYDGLLTTLDMLLKENQDLRAQVVLLSTPVKVEAEKLVTVDASPPIHG